MMNTSASLRLLLLLVLGLTVSACGNRVITPDDDDSASDDDDATGDDDDASGDDDDSASDDDDAAGDDDDATGDDDDDAGNDDTIYDMQSGAIAEGTSVTAEGVVVTAIVGATGYGMFVSEPAGGAESGIWVYVEEGAIAFEIGDLVDITGTLIEYSGPNGDWGGTVTEIDVAGDPAGTATPAGPGVVPAPSIIDAGIFADPVAIESFEGSLVRVENVSVTNPDAGFGEWEVGAGIVIDDMMVERPDFSVVGNNFSSITGVVHFTYGSYKIEPRIPEDIVPAP